MGLLDTIKDYGNKRRVSGLLDLDMKTDIRSNTKPDEINSGLLDLEFKVEVPHISEIDRTILSWVRRRLKRRFNFDTEPKDLEKKLMAFAAKVAEIESKSGLLPTNPESTAKGMYHFLDDTFPTAQNRLKNISDDMEKAKDFKGGFVVPSRISNAKSITDLNDDDQRTLFFAHLTEDYLSDENMIDLLKGTNKGSNLYLKNHWKGNSKSKYYDQTIKNAKEHFQ